MLRNANDNGTNPNPWQYPEVRGFDPHHTLAPVSEEELASNDFRRDACLVLASIISDMPHRQVKDYLMTEWARWPGRFVDAFGHEIMFDDIILEDTPDEWFRDHFKKRNPSDPAIQLRQENRERLGLVFSLAKIIKPASMALCGRRAANDD